MTEKIPVYIGDKPNYVYEQAGMNALTTTGQVFLLARGEKIPKCAYIAHRLETGYTGISIVSESTHMEELPDDGRRGRGNQRNTDEAAGSISDSVSESQSRSDDRPRMRHVVVYEARLILQNDEKQEASA